VNTAHHLFGRQNALTGSRPPPSALPRIEAVGPDAVVVAREHGAGAAEAGLHLVADQQDAARACRSRARAPGSRRADDDPGLALDRLDQERRGVRRDRRLERRGVAERNADEAGRERAEAVAVLRSLEKPMIVVVRPAKLPAATMISARPSATRLTL
jgi:hypothetical protein